ncbi:hypothetical protein L1887_12255 [Cichorium endivia]|nr:hypothetical protein L1887_12255 [Cichorium endivia]
MLSRKATRLFSLRNTVSRLRQTNKPFVASVGDCKAILCRAGCAIPLSKVTRSLGDDDLKPGITAKPFIQVTAVGDATMLAAIQIYVPSLMLSTYGKERLDLLRQLEKVKEKETMEGSPTVEKL